jgi:RNA polymerase sigma-70 factor (ECF subfamily)
LTERTIIKGCQDREPRYQKELVYRYSPMLMTVARRYVRDEASAKDVLQDALIRIFGAIDRYKPIGSFEAWMRRIVITTALQALDKSWYRRELPGLEEENDQIVIPEVYARLGAEELMKLIADLPDGFRQIFNLNVVEGYRHTEIAEMLGITESTSRSQLTRARKLLQKQILQREKLKI